MLLSTLKIFTMENKDKKRIYKTKEVDPVILDIPTADPTQKTTVAVIDKPIIREATLSLLNDLTSPDSFTAISAIRKKASYLLKGGRNDFSVLLGDNTTQISTIKKEYAPEKVAYLIYTILDDLNEHFNVSRKMTKIQLQNLSIDIMEELWSCRLEEILAFCHGLKKGAYIKIYERVDASIFWEAWALYEAEKLDYLHYNHLQLKGSTFKMDRDDDKTFTKIGNLSGAIDSIKSRYKKE